jgi:undecaprenyl-diphosphatase
VGSLFAVMFYFRHEVLVMFVAWIRSLHGDASADSRLAWWVMLGTLPAVIAGLVFKDMIELQLRSPWVIATTTIIFALLLWFADSLKSRNRSEYQVRLSDSLVVGFFQVLALIPGTSRSGITMTAGLMLGMTRQAAARFSFLLSIPIVLASGILQTQYLIQSEAVIDWFALLLAVVLSAVSAGLCIHLFLKLIENIGMLPFVIYRLLLGAFLIILLL